MRGLDESQVLGSAAVVDVLDSDDTVSAARVVQEVEKFSAYSEDPLFWSFCVIALAVMTLTGASVLLRAKTYGVLRLHGNSFAATLMRDLRQLSVFWLVSLAGTAAVTLAFLGFYYSFAALGFFVSVAAVAVALLLLAVLAVHAVILSRSPSRYGSRTERWLRSKRLVYLRPSLRWRCPPWISQ